MSGYILQLWFTYLMCFLIGGVYPKLSPMEDQYVKRNQTEKFFSVDDYEAAASQLLDRRVYVYFHDGSEEQITLRDNVLAYKRLTIEARVLVGVDDRKLDKQIFGKSVSFPFGTSPTALQKLATPEGEIANARASEAMGTIFTLSFFSNANLEDVAKAAPTARKWQNVYILRDRLITANVIRRAEQNGFEAVVIVVDAPDVGIKRQARGGPFTLPENMTFGNFGPEYGFTNNGTDFNTAFKNLLDPSITWKDILWVKSITKLRVILKGILSPYDAATALKYKVDGIFVSNHGGRQLDTAPATIDVLPKIVRRVAGRCLVIVDGGVRTGIDIFKALALGADVVFAGRPLIWGLAVDGKQGAENIIQIFKDELNRTMALAGVRDVEQITHKYVGRSLSPQPL